MIQWVLAVLSFVPLAFFKYNLNICKFLVHVLLKASLKDFEHYFASMWNEYNCVVVWAFFGIAFLWDWNENWPFPVLWTLLSFPNLLAYWVQHSHGIIFQDLKKLYWNAITSTSFLCSDAFYGPLDFTFQDVWLKTSDHTILIIWVMKIFFVQFFCVFLSPLLNIFCFFRYELNQIPYDYTVEVRNRLKGLDLIDKSAWWTMDGGSWHCTGNRDQDHLHGKEMQRKKKKTTQNSCLGRPYK